MNEMLTFEGARATQCQGSATHSPRPMRFAWHHIQPQAAGGQTATGNVVPLCDSCHMSTHALLWILAQKHQGTTLTPAWQYALDHPPRRELLKLALTGLNRCILAGTVADIPNEGGVAA